MSQSRNRINGNGSNRTSSIVIDDDPQQEPATAFFDPTNPVFAPPLQVDAGKKKRAKRRLVTLSFVVLLVLGGVGVLYLLLRVNRVNVKVQADARRDSQGNAPAKPDSRNSETGLTADAINIARQELGTDAESRPAPSPSPGVSPAAYPSPSTGVVWRPNLSATDNSPVFDRTGENNTKSDATASLQTQSAGMSQAKTANEIATNEVAKSRANSTQTIFVDDSLSKPTTAIKVQPVLRDEKKPGLKEKTQAAVLPPFGTMLPVRTQGVLFTLRNNSYARLELSRDVGGTGWSLPKGTVLVGRVSGSEYDRAFVNVMGYIDPRENKLVKMRGDVLGSDGAAGIPGKRMGVDRNRLKQTLRKVASSGVQVAGLLGGALGRGTVILDRSGYSIPDDLRGLSGGRDEKNAFVKVEAGQAAYVMVADLPKGVQAIDAPGEDELTRAAASLTDREVMELILLGTPDDTRAAVPLMNDEQKRLTLKTLAPEIEKK